MNRSTLLFSAVLLANIANAQQAKIYAVTAATKGNTQWSNLQQIDAANLSKTSLLQDLNNVNTANWVDALTGIPLQQQITSKASAPLQTMVAATAYDRVHNRLYFTPMQSNELHYMDLNKKNATIATNRQQLLKQFISSLGEADVITRMCFGADGFGYALTNDGNHLIKFSTGKQTQITDLGALVDGKNNGAISVHNQCSSWGGDMVGDAFGNLFLFSVRGLVFKIDTKTLVANLVGTVSNLPADFTINGTAVDADNNVIVSSSVKTDNYYSINLASLKAYKLESLDGVFNASDLASGYLAFEAAVVPKRVKINTNETDIKAYPNPITNNITYVNFSKIVAGNYQVEVMDVNGGTLIKQQVNATPKTLLPLQFTKSTKAGMYLLRVTNQSGVIVHQQKIILQ